MHIEAKIQNWIFSNITRKKIQPQDFPKYTLIEREYTFFSQIKAYKKSRFEIFLQRRFKKISISILPTSKKRKKIAAISRKMRIFRAKI